MELGGRSEETWRLIEATERKAEGSGCTSMSLPCRGHTGRSRFGWSVRRLLDMKVCSSQEMKLVLCDNLEGGDEGGREALEGGDILMN